MKHPRRWFYGALILFIIIILCSCQKEEYPRQFINFKATDCLYTITENRVDFVYMANHPDDKPYKRMSYTGFCKVRNVQKWTEDFIEIDTATITNGVVMYIN